MRGACALLRPGAGAATSAASIEGPAQPLPRASGPSGPRGALIPSEARRRTAGLKDRIALRRPQERRGRALPGRGGRLHPAFGRRRIAASSPDLASGHGVRAHPSRRPLDLNARGFRR